MSEQYNRRKFIAITALAGAGLTISGPSLSSMAASKTQKGKKVGIIGLDTSHSIAYTKSLNKEDADAAFAGYKIVAAYPYGSKTIKSSADRIPGFMEEVKKFGVEIVDSIDALLDKVDVVLLETNDGRPHLEQATTVFKAGKPVFIDKPVAASLQDVVAIYAAAEQYKIPVFSASSLRFMDSVQDVIAGKVGKVVGADAYSPATLESTHPDFYWYGIHGVEILMAVMGSGCKQVSRVHTDSTDIAVGVWDDGRIGTFRGTRTGKHTYGGTVYGENGDLSLGPYNGYDALLLRIIKFFETGIPPVSPKETIDIYAFMSAADESKLKGGTPVNIEEVMQKAK